MAQKPWKWFFSSQILIICDEEMISRECPLPFLLDYSYLRVQRKWVVWKFCPYGSRLGRERFGRWASLLFKKISFQVAPIPQDSLPKPRRAWERTFAISWTNLYSVGAGAAFYAANGLSFAGKRGSCDSPGSPYSQQRADTYARGIRKNWWVQIAPGSLVCLLWLSM